MFGQAQHKNPAQGNVFPTFTSPNFEQEVDNFNNEHFQGFIQHPNRFPIEIKTLRFWERIKIKETHETCDIGLTIFSEKYIKPGTILSVTIPTRKDIQKFTVKVVLLREDNNGYEIGLWLMFKEDEQRIRIVEQICHIELYLNDKRRKEGPFLSQEKITEEWITKFAASFP